MVTHKNKKITNKTIRNKKILHVASDCSGIDTPIMALRELGIPYRHVFSSEINEEVRDLISLNFNPELLFGDITQRDHQTELKNKKVDLYISGFPCQPFSSVGKREGLKDKKGRGSIFFHVLETIKTTKPTVFVLENVKGLLYDNGGKTFKKILKLLNELKNPEYNIYHQLLDTQHYGLPQQRRRVYIVGIRKGHEKIPFTYPEEQPLETTIMDYLDDSLTEEEIDELSSLTPHMMDVIDDSGVDTNENWVINVNTGNPQYASKLRDISPCLLSGNSSFYITSVGRKMSCREALRLQGVPDNFKTGNLNKRGIYRVAGNAMSVNVLKALFKQILEICIF